MHAIFPSLRLLPSPQFVIEKCHLSYPSVGLFLSDLPLCYTALISFMQSGNWHCLGYLHGRSVEARAC
jgi:hypothetical protein